MLKREVSLPGVMSPQNPYLNGGMANLPGSGGFEGMAINPAGDRLYTLLEGTVTGDASKTLRINEFSVDSESYTGASWRYKLENAGTAIGDMTAITSTSSSSSSATAAPPPTAPRRSRRSSASTSTRWTPPAT